MEVSSVYPYKDYYFDYDLLPHAFVVNYVNKETGFSIEVFRKKFDLLDSDTLKCIASVCDCYDFDFVTILNELKGFLK